MAPKKRPRWRLKGKHPAGDLWRSYSSRKQAAKVASKEAKVDSPAKPRSKQQKRSEEAQATPRRKLRPTAATFAVEEPESEPVKRRKCPREVQVMFHCKDRLKGFNRSITAKRVEDLVVLKSKMMDLKALAKTGLTYDEVVQALKHLREEFAEPPGGIFLHL
eukprot:symbB.v1.2.013212.t1/scaffold929.1/size151260/15